MSITEEYLSSLREFKQARTLALEHVDTILKVSAVLQLWKNHVSAEEPDFVAAKHEHSKVLEIRPIPSWGEIETSLANMEAALRNCIQLWERIPLEDRDGLRRPDELRPTS